MTVAHGSCRGFACLTQDAVMAGAVSQVQTDGQLGLIENLVAARRHSAHHSSQPVSFLLCLEHVDYWERIAPAETGLLIPSGKFD
jgi:hypothetical protein